jgi:acetyl esterase
MALDHATQNFLAQLKDSGVKPFHTISPSEGRELMASLRPMIGKGPEMKEVKEFLSQNETSEIRLRALIPSEHPAGMIVYFHGGGWVLMDIDDYDTVGRKLALDTDCVVVLVDYRLAPEAPFPAAIDDALGALMWALSNKEKLTGDQDVPLIVAGDSAGGNIATVAARKFALLFPKALALQALVYPVTQPNTNLPHYHDPGNQYLLCKEDMDFFWRLYIPNPKDREHPDASPFNSDALDVLPDTLIIGGEHEVLASDGLAYAEKLKSQNVKVIHKTFEGQIHGFFSLLNILPESARAIEYMAQVIRRYL